jgi:predicted ArsR family transcriptional regulator
VSATQPDITNAQRVLAVLADRRWHTSGEIVDETGLLPVAVRTTLKELANETLVSRSLTGGWLLRAPAECPARDESARGCGR